MDNLAQQLGRVPRDRGVRLDLRCRRGFKWLEFWKSTQAWTYYHFAPNGSKEEPVAPRMVPTYFLEVKHKSVIVE